MIWGIRDDKYDIDGIIITNNDIYERKDKNPDYSIAFKMVISDQIAEVKVLNVLWDASKDGYLKPTLQLEPVKLSGANIQSVTAFNAAFVEISTKPPAKSPGKSGVNVL